MDEEYLFYAGNSIDCLISVDRGGCMGERAFALFSQCENRGIPPAYGCKILVFVSPL